MTAAASSTKKWLITALCALSVTACNKTSAPPTTPTPSAPTLTSPTPDSPADQTQLSTLRPTLTVKNGTSDQAGTRTYEFQVSDKSDFSTNTVSVFTVVVNKTGVAEGGSGTTSLTVDSDLQPTTRFYWRARMTQGATVSAWSATRSFNSKLVGYNKAGELYDPLIFGETVGTIIGSSTWVDGKGLKLNNQTSYVRYQLPQTITNGEMSVEVEGLYANGPGSKLKIFSMQDGTGNLFDSKYQLNVQYRGLDGNPPNCISFKTLFGDEDFKLEPDIGRRTASVTSLDPNQTYYWKATWGTGINLQIKSGGINGTTFYDYGIQSPPGGVYNPPQHFVYLGATNALYGTEEGTWPGVTYRNLWVGNRPRPATLGSALSAK